MVTEIKRNYVFNYGHYKPSENRSDNNKTFYQQKRTSDNKTEHYSILSSRSRSLTASIIYENEQDIFYHDKITTVCNINNKLKMEEKEGVKLSEEKLEFHREKIPYKNRKHFSDYVYLQVEDENGSISSKDSNDSHKDMDDSHKYSNESLVINTEQNDNRSEEVFRKSKSDSSLWLPPKSKAESSSRRTCHHQSHVDITETQTYKEIYADNIRQYSFLLAKQLGTSQSPDQLRKSYIKSRRKAVERRERISDEPSSRKTSVSSNVSTSSLESLKSSKYTSSLTDITSIVNEKDYSRRPTTVIRRKHKKKYDMNKRLSAPQLNSHLDIEKEEEKSRKISLPAFLAPVDDNLHPVSISVPDLTDPDSVVQSQQRKLSAETLQRQREAKERLEWRLSRLTSFEGVLDRAGSLIKNYKRKRNSNIQIEIETNDEETFQNGSYKADIKSEIFNNNKADVSNDNFEETIIVDKQRCNNNVDVSNKNINISSNVAQIPR